MKIVIDIILCAIIAAGILFGVKFGFVKIAAKPVKFILALIIAFSFCSAVGESVVAPIIDTPVSGYVSDYLYDNCGDITAENAEEELPTLLKLAAGAAGIDVSEAAGEGDVIANLVDALIDPVIGIISVIFAFFALYILARIALSIVFGVVNTLLDNGVLGAVNKLLGVIFATVIAIMMAWAAAVMLELLFHSAAFESNPQFSDFEGGFFYKLFNKYNPIELLLSF